MDFSGGVNSLKPTTISSVNLPNGLGRNQTSWLVNATTRGGTLSPRAPWNKKGWINGSLPPTVIPGTPQQTIPQPNLPPAIQTPSTQNLYVTGAAVPPPYGWVWTAVGSQSVMSMQQTQYVGNIGDTVDVQLFENGGNQDIGNFLVVGIAANSLTLQTISLSSVLGGHLWHQTAVINLVQISAGTPQPPKIIPAGPPTIIPTQPLFQGATVYEPLSGNPYVIAVIGGHVIRIDPDWLSEPLDLSIQFGFSFPAPLAPRCFFCQGEEFLVIQAGDYDPASKSGTLPLIWDGQKLYQSNGLTNVLIVGTPIPIVYNLNQTSNTSTWQPAAAGLTSSVTLASAYPGNLYDNLYVADGTGGAGHSAYVRVVGISGTQLTLKTLYISGAVSLTGPITATLHNPVDNTGADDVTQAVTIGDGSWTIPNKIGQQATIILTAVYFGNVGDTVEFYSADGSKDYGSFTVISNTAPGTLVVQYAAKGGSTDYSGQAIFGPMLANITAVRSFTQTAHIAPAGGHGGAFTVPPVGGTISMFFPAFHPLPWGGKQWDTYDVKDDATGADLGTFRYIAVGQFFDGDHSYPNMTWQAVNPNPNYIGQSFPYISATVVAPSPASGILQINAGQWSVPQIGSAVQAQMVWPDALGPSYPGSLGDIVELMQGVTVIGYFQVKAFDMLGNITLVTMSNSTYATPPASIGQVFTGAVSLTMIIVQVPSYVGEKISQIPAATCMAYYRGMIWYAQGSVVSAGDIVGGPSGTPAYGYRDSILCVTENPLAFGGDGFKLPIAGNITGMAWPAQINASLGQGLLYIGTINGICSLSVPASRSDWISMTANALPQMNVVADSDGFVNDWCIASINGDLYFVNNRPGIESVIQAQRWFDQYGNVDISSNEIRAWQQVDRSLLGFCSGIYFDDTLLETTLPLQTPYGVAHNGIIPLDMIPINTLEQQLPPNWLGAQCGLQIFQLIQGSWGNVERAFALTLSNINPGEIDLWELTKGPSYNGLDNGNSPIEWEAELPAFTVDEEFDVKKLVAGELWVDRIFGTVEIEVRYRPDGLCSWLKWGKFRLCSALNTAPQNVPYPVVYYGPNYASTLTLPEPSDKAPVEIPMQRPPNLGYQFQAKITVTGQCRVRGFLLHMTKQGRELYQNLAGTRRPVCKEPISCAIAEAAISNYNADIQTPLAQAQPLT